MQNLAILIQYQHLMDKQTDGWTNGQMDK